MDTTYVPQAADFTHDDAHGEVRFKQQLVAVITTRGWIKLDCSITAVNKAVSQAITGNSSDQSASDLRRAITDHLP